MLLSLLANTLRTITTESVVQLEKDAGPDAKHAEPSLRARSVVNLAVRVALVTRADANSREGSR